MFFYMPVKVYAEDDCVKNHAAQLSSFGKKALIVTGRHSAKANGSLDDVTGVLDSAGIKWACFSDIEENPSVETVMQARDMGVSEEVDFVIGIGGGSPMDAAKAISLMIRNRDQDESFLYDKSATTSVLPIVEIPTTCGTGSEVTAVSVLTRHKLHTKASIAHKIFADLALIDGKYLASASHRVLTNTSMDALAHLYESYINSKATDYSRAIVDTGLSIWRRNKDIILGRREAVSADYTNLMNASMFAGMAIAHTGTSLPHGLSYALTYNTHMAHGKACGYFLPGYLREADAEDVKHILTEADFSGIDDLEKYYEATCGRDSVDSSVLELSVQDLLANPAKMQAAPFPVDEAVLRRIAGV